MVLPTSQDPERPIIISAFSCPTKNIASYSDLVISPLWLPFQQLNNTMTGECFLYTMVIESLYTIIPINDDLKALAYFLDKYPVLNDIDFDVSFRTCADPQRLHI